MAQVEPTDKSMFWGVELAGEIAYTGTNEIGVHTSVNPALVLYQADNENDYLGLVAGKGGDYNPLPLMGEWCEGGMIYGYDDGLVICRRDHTRTEHAPETIPDLFVTYRVDGGTLEWIPNESVIVGDRRTYDDIEYSCIQPHVTQVDWTPPATVGVLWEVVPGDEYLPWVQPEGAHDAYKLGARVTHNGHLWENVGSDANVYEPGVWGWDDLGVYP